MQNKIEDLTKKETPPLNMACDNFFVKNKLNSMSDKFTKGDVIEFTGGCDRNIRFRATIFGFIRDESCGLKRDKIFIKWSCYWLPIKDDKSTKITINKQT